MNRLSIADRAKVIRLLVEGNSMSSCARIMDVSFNTVKNILIDVGQACENFHNEKVVNLNSQRIEMDEIWSFVYAKERNVQFSTKSESDGVGDAWTWVAVDADSKLVVSWLVGNRDVDTAHVFVSDVASRLRNKVQLSTDGYKNYIIPVATAFEYAVDFAQIIKVYGSPSSSDNPERKYSPATVTSVEKKVIFGKPNYDLISTSYVERQNLTMRMGMRRFTRLTNAFSKKIEHHRYAIAIHYAYYNFVRIHKSLRVTPAMEAKLTTKPMTIEDIVRMAYADEIEAERRRLERRGIKM
jgi:IS1 family transposase